MDRRDFLKLCGFGAATLAVPVIGFTVIDADSIMTRYEKIKWQTQHLSNQDVLKIAHDIAAWYGKHTPEFVKCSNCSTIEPCDHEAGYVNATDQTRYDNIMKFLLDLPAEKDRIILGIFVHENVATQDMVTCMGSGGEDGERLYQRMEAYLDRKAG